MKIGYLHLGPSEHGVCRYGKLLAQQAKKQGEIEVIEYDLQITNNAEENSNLFEVAANYFIMSKVNVIHFQFSCFSNATLWGKEEKEYNNLKTFFDRCSIPLVVTIHDLFLDSNIWKTIFKPIFKRLKNKLTSTFFSTISNQVELQVGFFGYRTSCLDLLLNKVNLALLFTEDQYQAVRNRYGNRVKKCSVIPHFVETRNIKISKTEARKILDLENHTVITLLGFIYPGKGHELLIKALTDLPEDVKIIFAGGIFKGDTDKSLKELLITELMCLGEESQVGNRIKITGYLSEEELEMYLKATDVAVCPHYQATASGTLSTWISVGCPIVASDIPVFRAYDQIQPDVIKFFHPYTSYALAKAIKKLLKELEIDKIKSEKIELLGKKLSISNILQQHLTSYRNLI
jgi:glycosyltransferase involved in cell wall biosynthesis